MTDRRGKLRWALGIAALASCSEAEFRLEVVLPNGVEDRAAQTELLLVRPSASITCDTIAFGEVSDTALAAQQVLAIRRFEAGSVDLGAIQRDAPLLFVARALDRGGALVAGGCLSSSILEEQTYVLAMEPASVLGLVSDRNVDRKPSDPNPVLEISVTNDQGMPMASAYRYRVGDHTSPAYPIEGRAEVELVPPAPPGPYQIEFRSRWSRAGALVVQGLIWPNSESMAIELPGPVVDARVTDSELTFLVRTGTDRWQLVHSEGQRLRLVPGPDGAGRFPILTALGESECIVVTERDWFNVSEGEARTSMTFHNRHGAPVGAFNITDCDGGRPAVMVSYENRATEVYFPDGSFMNGVDGAIQALAGGCVQDQDGQLQLTYVLEDDFSAFVGVEQENGLYFRDWLVARQPIHISRDNELYAIQVNLNEFVVSRSRLSLQEEGLDVVALESFPIPRFVTSLATGDINGDGQVDVVGVHPTEGSDGFSLWMADGGSKMVVSAHLVGEAVHIGQPQLMMYDFEGDGVDEVVLADRDTAQLVIYAFSP